MFDLGLFFIFTNIFLLMVIFWILSWLGEKLYKIKYYSATTEVYECGFFTFHTLRIEINLSFVIIALLLILYDIEFFFLIPFLFNCVGVNLVASIIFWSFAMIVLISFLIDWTSVVVQWIG